MEIYKFDEQYRQFLERVCIPFAIYQFVDQRIHTLIVSQGLCDIMQMSKEDVYYLFDHDMYRDTHPDDMARVANASYRFATMGEDYDVVYRTRESGGNGYNYVHAQGKHYIASDGTDLSVVWYIVENVKGAKRFESELDVGNNLKRIIHEESLIRENYYDSLTGLPNMSYFLRLAEEEKKLLGEFERLSILFFDLSGMKSFNEKYGFAEGDNLLRIVAETLKKYYRGENCSRLGQDHFAVFTREPDFEESLSRIFEELQVANNGRTLPVRVGIYEDRFEEVDASTACDRAKIACDQDRHAYISGFKYYDEELRKYSLKKDYVLDNFGRALREGWIQPFFHPIVRTVNRKVCDEEALSRWIDPSRGMISPAEFVPVLEDAKLIYKLDLKIIDGIIAYIQKKLAKGIGVVPVSVNISRYDFKLCDMVKEICKRMDNAGIDRKFLVIELTESVVGIDQDFLKFQVKRLREAGFKVWMDDFGSGYSSLNILQDFDFDLIKFDMRFMRELGKSKKSPIIMTKLMQMAIKLGIDTVAEGVETEEQLSFLKEIGCDKAQGYLFSRPTS
ncbi:MAG: bifunctional diguanylate cyclase/phosphodiesterase, partial [Lachnospiraceae bacterium]|nr:bifunctional diguanylate cyclase/phosphodiesterase [Lachnospiraceae bacterium]